jgi:hypothetical protein
LWCSREARARPRLGCGGASVLNEKGSWEAAVSIRDPRGADRAATAVPRMPESCRWWPFACGLKGEGARGGREPEQSGQGGGGSVGGYVLRMRLQDQVAGRQTCSVYVFWICLRITPALNQHDDDNQADQSPVLCTAGGLFPGERGPRAQKVPQSRRISGRSVGTRLGGG